MESEVNRCRKRAVRVASDRGWLVTFSAGLKVYPIAGRSTMTNGERSSVGGKICGIIERGGIS